jgi:hypothetical protein
MRAGEPLPAAPAIHRPPSPMPGLAFDALSASVLVPDVAAEALSARTALQFATATPLPLQRGLAACSAWSTTHHHRRKLSWPSRWLTTPPRRWLGPKPRWSSRPRVVGKVTDEADAGVGHGAPRSPPTQMDGRPYRSYAFKHRYAAQRATVETRHGSPKGLVSLLATERRALPGWPHRRHWCVLVEAGLRSHLGRGRHGRSRTCADTRLVKLSAPSSCSVRMISVARMSTARRTPRSPPAISPYR